MLLHELRAVISHDAAYVNYRHLALLADVMTCKLPSPFTWPVCVCVCVRACVCLEPWSVNFGL